MARNVICLWYDDAAEEAARFYAQTFPNSEVTAVHRAPSDFPGGRKGQVLTVEFTVVGADEEDRRRHDRSRDSKSRSPLNAQDRSTVGAVSGMHRRLN